MQRRYFLLLPLVAFLQPCPVRGETADASAIRIGLTPVFLDNQVALLNAWEAYLAKHLRQPVRFMQRGSYREVVDLLRKGELDFAWICGYPFVRHQPELTLVAVPLFRQAPVYQSYLIVPATDTATRSILDLRGMVFAFVDPDSNSGYLYPTHSLLQLRESPDGFFRRTFFTRAHRQVVEAVAAGLANGGAVDSYVWETLNVVKPELTSRTRVVDKSPPFGFPPFVAHRQVPPATFAAVQAALLQMPNDSEGAALLQRLNLDGFTLGEAALFESIKHMAEALDAQFHVPAQ